MVWILLANQLLLAITGQQYYMLWAEILLNCSEQAMRQTCHSSWMSDYKKKLKLVSQTAELYFLEFRVGLRIWQEIWRYDTFHNIGVTILIFFAIYWDTVSSLCSLCLR